MMLSLSKARELRSAGLKWESKEGDWYGLIDCATGEAEGPYFAGEKRFGYFCNVIPVWVPRLDQLLAEIEARGYTELSLSTINKSKKGYVFELLGQGLLPSKVVGSYYYAQYPTFKADTPEDTAADALLWILQEAEK